MVLIDSFQPIRTEHSTRQRMVMGPYMYDAQEMSYVDHVQRRHEEKTCIYAGETHSSMIQSLALLSGFCSAPLAD